MPPTIPDTDERPRTLEVSFSEIDPRLEAAIMQMPETMSVERHGAGRLLEHASFYRLTAGRLDDMVDLVEKSVG